jgi:hypothetical protein
MSMRRQLYEWQINRQTNGYTWPSPTVGGVTFEQIAGIPFSIFTGGIGNNITEPAATKATQFIAIDNIRCSPSFFLSGAAVTTLYKTLGGPAGAAGIATGIETNPANPGNIVNSPNPTYTPNGGNAPELTFQTTHVNPFTSIAGPLMFMQVLINTTSYFDETDGTVGPGLPGSASPCPETASCRSTFDFESPIYILPGQQWDVQVTVYNDSRANIGVSASTNPYHYAKPGYNGPEDLCCLVQYTLYDGPDALIATKLVEMGIAVRPENVDWYKRQLLEGTL